MIEVERADFSFPGSADVFLSLRNLELDWKGVATLSGPSGSGKTTLFRVLTGWYEGRGGICSYKNDVKVFEDIRLIGAHPSLLPWRSVADNLRLQLARRGEINVSYLLGQVALEDSVGYLFPYQLSLGMYKRVELLGALEQGPKLLLLDEFFSSVGEEQKVIVAEYLRSRRGNAMTLVTAHERELRHWIGGDEFGLEKRENCVVGICKQK